MRRSLAGLTAFLAMTGTLLVLPVYAAPVPPAEPVEPSIEELVLGSVTDPAGEAVVATDGEPFPGGVEPSEAPDVPEPAPSDAPSSDVPTAPEETVVPTEEPAAPPASDVPGDDVVSSGAELVGVPALTVSQPDTAPFSTVGVTWRQDGVTDVVVQLRVKRVDGAWGEWTTLDADDIEQTPSSETAGHEIRGGTAPYWTDTARGIEVIVQGAGGVVPEDVRVALIDPGSSAADDIPATPAVQDTAHAGVAMPTIVARAQWGADESLRTWNPEYAATIKAATLHHTADRNSYSSADVPGMMRSIYAYHSVTRGWGDIGYNVIVDRFGRIFEGRYGGLSSTVVGAHAGGFNTGTFGVSMLGNYDEVDTPGVMVDSVAAVIAWKFGLYGVDPRGTTQLTSGGSTKYAKGTVVTLPTVHAHRDVGSTACPGQYGYARLGEIRDGAAARMSQAPGGSPIGNLEQLELKNDRLTVSGWTFDPDYPQGGLAVAVDVDNVRVANLVADKPRADVGAAYPEAGPNHGFSGSTTLARGQRRVCVYVLNAPPSGLDSWEACRVFNVTTTTTDTTAPSVGANPIGNFEGMSVSGKTLSAGGWTFDPDTPTTALDVHVYVNGRWGGSLVADGLRSDVGGAYPEAGSRHGFRWSATVTEPGAHEVCIFAINRDGGTANPQLGCRTATVSAALWNPIGTFDSATVSGRDVTLSGWALDQDTPTDPLALHVYVGGRWGRVISADTERRDVGAAYPGVGDRHGFRGTLEVPAGRHPVCAYLINTGHGSTNPLLSCKEVTVQPEAWNPFGSLDGVSVAGNVVTAGGWVVDPSNWSAPADVHVYVDGVWRAARAASGQRPDVGSAYPRAGAAHGYSIPITVSPGRHQVCVYAINTGDGSTNPLIDCRTVTA